VGGSLTIVGTGFVAGGQATLEALAAIVGAEKLLYLTSDPVAAHWLRGLNSTAESLADSYAAGRDRGDTYAEMVVRMLEPVRAGARVCAAFYGHPGVFVDPSHAAIAQALAEGLDACMQPGISAEDCLFADLGLDPGQVGCQSFEATDFLIYRRRFDPRSLLILWQIGAIGVLDFRPGVLWSRRGLRVLTEALAVAYPLTHEVTVYEASSFAVCRPRMDRMPLQRLPRARVTLASTLVVPPAAASRLDRRRMALLGLD
jgi:Tetrapyrrole (Corrin/Porphyrin) Methylases